MIRFKVGKKYIAENVVTGKACSIKVERRLTKRIYIDLNKSHPLTVSEQTEKSIITRYGESWVIRADRPEV